MGGVEALGGVFGSSRKEGEEKGLKLREMKKREYE